MTKFRGSPLPEFSPRRRSLLLAGLGGVGGVLGGLGHSAAAVAGPSSATSSAASFDFDNGNFLRDIIAPFQPARDDIAPMDVPILERLIHYWYLSWFDATAPYHPTAVGIYSRLGRRPASEAATNRNKNIAGLYSSYQVLRGLDPVVRGREFRDVLISVGLDPDDESTDRTSPVGLGNLAGKAVVAAALQDGMNQLGNMGRRYNGQPFEDYTGYKPVNTAYDLVNPSRWQPQPGPHNRRLAKGFGDQGAFIVQQFSTPQLRLTKAHTFQSPAQFKIAPPSHSDASRPKDYKQSVDEILSASAGLTDRQKVTAEFFDDKRLGVGSSVAYSVFAHPGLDLDGWIQAAVTGSVALFDASIAAWHQKVKYDSVRPWSAVRHVYGKSPVSAWGGPGIGTVHDMPANEWASYLSLGDHAEYPSGSTTLCSAEAQAMRRFFDDDVLNLTWRVPAGSTLVETGLTPAQDIVLNYPNWDGFVHDCAISRVWGGVHFKKTVERSIDFGMQFGDLAYEYVQRHIQGKVDS